MTGLDAFLGKEFKEIVRTWRLPTVGGVLLFFAVMSPLAALATPAILASVTASQPGVVIQVPDPTYLDSYAQWVKNLTQVGLFLVVFSSAGLIAGERGSGTAALVVTKPVSRMSFAVAKYLGQAALVTVSTVIGTVVTYVGTILAFGPSPVGPLVVASGAWLLSALLAVAITETLSSFLPTLAAGIGTLVLWGLGGLLSLLPLAALTPVALLGAPSAALLGQPLSLASPIVLTVLLIAALVWCAGLLFGRREL